MPARKTRFVPPSAPDPEAMPSESPSIHEQLATIYRRRDELKRDKASVENDFDKKIKALEEEALPLEMEVSKEYARHLLEAVPYLLPLVPDHSLTTCSDARPNNPDRSCRRCQLLNIKEWNASDYEIDFSFRERY